MDWLNDMMGQERGDNDNGDDCGCACEDGGVGCLADCGPPEVFGVEDDEGSCGGPRVAWSGHCDALAEVDAFGEGDGRAGGQAGDLAVLGRLDRDVEQVDQFDVGQGQCGCLDCLALVEEDEIGAGQASHLLEDRFGDGELGIGEGSDHAVEAFLAGLPCSINAEIRADTCGYDDSQHDDREGRHE